MPPSAARRAMIRPPRPPTSRTLLRTRDGGRRRLERHRGRLAGRLHDDPDEVLVEREGGDARGVGGAEVRRLPAVGNLLIVERAGVVDEIALDVLHPRRGDRVGQRRHREVGILVEPRRHRRVAVGAKIDVAVHACRRRRARRRAARRWRSVCSGPNRSSATAVENSFIVDAGCIISPAFCAKSVSPRVSDTTITPNFPLRTSRGDHPGEIALERRRAVRRRPGARGGRRNDAAARRASRGAPDGRLRPRARAAGRLRAGARPGAALDRRAATLPPDVAELGGDDARDDRDAREARAKSEEGAFENRGGKARSKRGGALPDRNEATCTPPRDPTMGQRASTARITPSG